MKLKNLEKEVIAELAEEKNSIAKSILKERIREIGKVEKVLAKLKKQYSDMLEKSVEEIVDGEENANIRL
jgi:rRNA processing protein Gar1